MDNEHDYDIIAKRLSKHIEVVDQMMSHLNLRVLNVSCRTGNSDGGCFTAYVEICSIDGNEIPSDVCIKMNTYDSDGNLVDTSNTSIRAKNFIGYDTVSIYFSQDCALDEAASGRLYATRW